MSRLTRLALATTLALFACALLTSCGSTSSSGVFPAPYLGQSSTSTASGSSANPSSCCSSTLGTQSSQTNPTASVLVPGQCVSTPQEAAHAYGGDAVYWTRGSDGPNEWSYREGAYIAVLTIPQGDTGDWWEGQAPRHATGPATVGPAYGATIWCVL